MGIIDFIKGGVREMMLARPDDKKDLLVYKHPDGTVPMYSQLTVDADEAAVFFRDGSIVGVLRSAGVGQRHTLSAQNIPFLSNAVDAMTGGNIFTTDLFFVTTRPVFDQQFGGELGVMEDPLLGEMISPRIFGTFAFEIVDPGLFILKFIGLKQAGSNDDVLRWVKGLFLNSVRTVMGQVLVEQQTSMLQLMAMQQLLANRFTESAPDLNAIGCRILQMGQFNINLSDEDKARLQEAQSEIGAAKRAARVANISVAKAAAEAQQKQFGLDQTFQQDARYVQQLAGSYQNYAAGQALIGAGKGMAEGGASGDGSGGGAMMGGAALGVGMAMAQQLARGVLDPSGRAPAPGGGGGAGGGGAAPAPAPGQVTCPSCAKQVVAGKFCAECGASLAPKKRICAVCSAEGQPGARFCAGCGTAFSQDA